MRAVCLAFAVLSLAPAVQAQEAYTRRNTFTAFAEYSSDSSHIILGGTPNRKLTGFGGQYERRLVQGKYANLAYVAEFRPFILSSDVIATSAYSGTETFMGMTSSFSGSNTEEVLQCVPGTATYSGPPPEMYTETVITTCSRQTTIAQGGSPIGLRVNLSPGKRLQVEFTSNGGYMFATKPIPIPTAGAFNFTFNFGGGLEYYTSARRSVRLEYLVQHYSNHYTAQDNPGVDSGFVRLAYAFGR